MVSVLLVDNNMTFVTICYATTYWPTSCLATKVMDELAVATWRVQWDAFTGRAGRIPPPSGDCHRSANFRYNPAQLPNLNFSSSSTRAEEDILVPVNSNKVCRYVAQRTRTD